MNARTRRLATNETVVHAVLDDEAVLLNVETGIYFGLDALGARIWDLLVQGTTEEEIVRQLHSEYDVSRDQLQTDVSEFLQLLESKGLARVIGVQ